MGENHFWVTTVPRTGSMWTFNVVRGLAQMAGRQVHPETVPIDDHSMFEIYHRATATDHVSQSIYTYKVHGKLGYVLPESKYLTTIRDPREIIVSFMRFMKVDFEIAFENVKALKDLVDYYSSFDGNKLLMVNYEDIVSKPVYVVKNIAKFMNLDATDEMVNKVAANLDPVRVRSNIAMNDMMLEVKKEQTGQIDASEVVFFTDDHYRAFDVKTGFQTGHVSEMTREDYRAGLTKEQVDRINEYFGDWFERYGFSREF